MFAPERSYFFCGLLSLSAHAYCQNKPQKVTFYMRACTVSKIQTMLYKSTTSILLNLHNIEPMLNPKRGSLKESGFQLTIHLHINRASSKLCIRGLPAAFAIEDFKVE